MNYEDLTQEQREKVAACNSVGELLALAEAEGVELADEQLEHIAGGGWGFSTTCPNCGCTEYTTDHTGTANMVYICKQCGTVW